jgi:hypothetical protein
VRRLVGFPIAHFDELPAAGSAVRHGRVDVHMGERLSLLCDRVVYRDPPDPLPPALLAAWIPARARLMKTVRGSEMRVICWRCCASALPLASSATSTGGMSAMASPFLSRRLANRGVRFAIGLGRPLLKKGRPAPRPAPPRPGPRKKRSPPARPAGGPEGRAGQPSRIPSGRRPRCLGRLRPWRFRGRNQKPHRRLHIQKWPRSCECSTGRPCE